MAAEPTVGEHLATLLPRLACDTTVPAWPADVFALCLSLLLKSRAYCGALTQWPPTPTGTKATRRGGWAEQIVRVGREWRRLSITKKSVPDRVRDLWRLVIGATNNGITSVVKNTRLCHALLELCAAADEASEGIGGPQDVSDNPTEQRFLNHADELLRPDPVLGSTLCEEIHRTRARVLPKVRTPQNGLTVRSLSLYLALCSSDEMIPEWYTVPAPALSSASASLNVLLIPWPLKVYPSQFRSVKPLAEEMRNMPEAFGFFTFHHRSGDIGVVKFVEQVYETAAVKMGKIDGVVLPELAMTPEEHDRLRDYVVNQKSSFLVTGVGIGSDSGKRHGKNQVCLDLPLADPLIQHKHHRWRLNSPQILQYGLGGLLHPETTWWEHISLGQRRLHFISLGPLVLSVLICEDLARPDPVGDLVRAVGPNLVIALLMDGPQLKDRWASRYATTLAEDPGCSVLSLTSLGMSNLSRPSSGPSRPNVIALWKDASHAATEIELPDGCDAVVLSLSMCYLEEWAADGRNDDKGAGSPTLSGVHPIKLPDVK